MERTEMRTRMAEILTIEKLTPELVNEFEKLVKGTAVIDDVVHLRNSEEIAARMKAIKLFLDEQAVTFNDVSNIPELTYLASKVDDGMRDAVAEYTELAQMVCFASCLASADPMIEAARQLVFDTYRIKDTKDKDAGTVVRSVENAEKPIDIKKLHAKAPSGIGHGSWLPETEIFNCLITCAVAMGLGYDAADLKSLRSEYCMMKTERAINMGKTPTSNSQVLKSLNELIGHMIGEEYHATSHDVVYLKNALTKTGKKRDEKGRLVIECANHTTARTVLLGICHTIILRKDGAFGDGRSYGVTSREIKKQK